MVGAMSGQALAVGPPVNSAPPLIEPAPHVGRTVTATTGEWKNEGPGQWFACAKQAGGKYTSATCLTEGSPKEWGSLLLKEGESVSIIARGAPMSFTATLAGVKVTIACETEVTGASLKNPTGGGSGEGALTIAYKGCIAKNAKTEAVMCKKATAGAATQSTLSVTVGAGKLGVSVAPKEGVSLAKFTLAECEIAGVNGNYQLEGSMLGTVSTAASKLEFNAETSGTGALRLNSSIKTTATGSIAVETTAGGYIKAEAAPITYSYAWNRCVSSSCAAISGATGASYMPVVGDLGYKLTVSVTATNASGQTTATSSQSPNVNSVLSWYACGKWGGAGVYENSTCTTKGALKAYEWGPQTSGTVHFKNSYPGGEKPPLKLQFVAPGGGLENITCTGAEGAGAIHNTESSTELSSFAFSTSGCTASAFCVVKNNKIQFEPLKVSAVEPSEPSLRFEQVGVTLGSFTLEGCKNVTLNTTLYLAGSIPARVNNAQSSITTGMTESKELLEIQGFGYHLAAGLEMGGTLSFGTEGNAMKLDVAP